MSPCSCPRPVESTTRACDHPKALHNPHDAPPPHPPPEPHSSNANLGSANLQMLRRNFNHSQQRWATQRNTMTSDEFDAALERSTTSYLSKIKWGQESEADMQVTDHIFSHAIARGVVPTKTLEAAVPTIRDRFLSVFKGGAWRQLPGVGPAAKTKANENGAKLDEVVASLAALKGEVNLVKRIAVDAKSTADKALGQNAELRADLEEKQTRMTQAMLDANEEQRLKEERNEARFRRHSDKARETQAMLKASQSANAQKLEALTSKFIAFKCKATEDLRKAKEGIEMLDSQMSDSNEAHTDHSNDLNEIEAMLVQMQDTGAVQAAELATLQAATASDMTRNDENFAELRESLAAREAEVEALHAEMTAKREADGQLRCVRRCSWRAAFGSSSKQSWRRSSARSPPCSATSTTSLSIYVSGWRRSSRPRGRCALASANSVRRSQNSPPSARALSSTWTRWARALTSPRSTWRRRIETCRRCAQTWSA
jgi:hypothetical protein